MRSETLADARERVILAALRGRTRKAAALFLGVTPRTLARWIVRLAAEGVEVPEGLGSPTGDGSRGGVSRTTEWRRARRA